METEYFIALEPEKKLFDKILNTKKFIFKKYSNQLFLSDLPHCTIYVSVTNNLQLVSEILDKISKENKFIPITISNDYLIFPEDKLANSGSAIGLSFDKKAVNEIRELQDEIISKLNKIRVGIPNRYKNVKLNKNLMESIEIYGFPFVEDKMKTKILIPHISFCAFSKIDELQNFIKLNPIENYLGDYSFNSLVLYKLNQDNSSEKLKEFKLKKL